ncbi:MAG: proton-conducting transporter membrane subunit [Desulfobulbaceae bacterium]
MAFADSWIVVPVFAPLTAALFAFLVRRGSFFISLAAVCLNLLAAAVLVDQFLVNGPAAYAVGGWDPPLGICLRTDGPALIMLVLTAVAGVGITLYAKGYFTLRIERPSRIGRPERQERFFWPLWMLQLTGLNGLYLSGDIFNLYVTLEVIGVSAAALAALSGKSASLVAALRYLLVSLLGSLSYLLGVVFVYKTYGVLDLALLMAVAAPAPGVIAAMALMSVGLLLKTAIFPMHFWLPPAHANALAPVSAILSGLVVKGSFFLLFRLWFDIFSPALPAPAFSLMGTLGAGAVIWGGVQALRQQRLKLMIAYSTVSQLGYLVIAFPLAFAGGGSQAWGAVLFMAAGHACAKIAMFMSAGTIMLHAGHDRIRDLAGIRAYLPVTAFAYAAAGVNLIGLPPSGGFIAKWMLLITALASHQWLWAVVLLAGSFLAAAYVFRVVAQLFVIPPDKPVIVRRRAGLLEWPALIMALISLLLGLIAPYPLRLLEAGEMVRTAMSLGGGP